jgi:hypothetical protein
LIDYRLPSALLVPHTELPILDVLEIIAEEASRLVGVILLSTDPKRRREFVARIGRSSRFRIVEASFDTPWIRDNSPIPIAKRGY